MIQPGASIEVLAVRGTRVLVREATDSAVAEATPAAAGEELLATDEGLRSPPAPLDFDVPQG
jgi:hypothetical protein